MPPVPFEIKVDDRPVASALDALQRVLVDLTPAMRDIAEALRTETEENFLREGRPGWKDLAPSTVKARGSAHPILQRSGQLAASVDLVYDRTSASVGSNKVYAAIHQFGGQAGRGRRVTIPARPFLPVDASGNLHPEAQRTVLEVISDHLASRK